MTFEQSLSSRLVAIPVNIIIAVPYGIYRDFAMRQARRISPARWMKNMADVLAYVTFQSPVYVAILWSVGADWHQIVAAVSSNLAVSMMMGAAYGYSTIAAACSAWRLSAGEGLTNALAATGSASRLFPPARLAWILKCLSPY